MVPLPWTKFQDFYLRLGFLKVLVAALSPQRRSALNDAVIRRLASPLFDPAPDHPELWERVRGRMGRYPRTTASGRVIGHPETAEALLVDGATESLLYGITRDTAYKILDWGHDVEFVGRANQISERGLMLRHLLPLERVERFLSGHVLDWNPFVLESRERLFFLYQLVEIDRVTVEIIDFLAALDPGSVLEAGDAARITCRAIFNVLDSVKDSIEPRAIPAYRTARELAWTIAEELGLRKDQEEGDGWTRRRTPKAVKPAARRSAFLGGTGAGKPRKTTKNADHQTVPRFEQLVDLGFLEKVTEDPAGGEAALLAGRRRWRYVPTAACRLWAEAKRTSGRIGIPFQWHGFAATVVAAFHHGPNPSALHLTTRPDVIAEYLWVAYQKVRRQMGHTPFDSVALHAVLDAACEGVPLEMTAFHDLMLSIKRRNALPDHAFFASGNGLDKMFIQLRPGFVEHVRRAFENDPPGGGV